MIERSEYREQLICQNMNLVYPFVNRFKGRGIEYEDLYQAGCMGLIKAADHFDPERGVKFSTYAVPVILGEIKKLFREGGSVKVSRSLKETGMKVARAAEAFAKREGRQPTVNELAEILEMESAQVAQAIGAVTAPLSLTDSQEDGEEGQNDLPVESFEDGLTDVIAVRDICKKLPERDRQIILLRFFQRKTQSQTAQELGMTQVQVSRLEKRILLSLRQQMTG